MSGDFTNSRPLGRLWPLVLIVFLGLFAGLVSLRGCGRVSDSQINRGGNKHDPTPGNDLLNAAVSMMQPDRLGINAQPQQAAGLLNQWRSTQLELTNVKRLSEPLPEETRSFLETHLPGEAVARAERDDYTIDDAKHVRTSRLMKTIVDHVAKGVDGELSRAQVVFEYVTRNVGLVSEDEALPLMPYEILVFGQGTAADRAWVFAELLRQLNQDAVIVRPDSSDPAAQWFVAAVAHGKLHLFDPLRSAAVPRGNGDESIPATLSDLSDPAVWRALTGDANDNSSTETLKTIRIEVIGTSALWAPRHARLESVLTGSDSVVIYQKLTGPKGDSSAILNRVSKAKTANGGKIDLGAWSHSESRLAEYQTAGSLDEYWKPFLAPLQIAVDPESGEAIIGNPTRGQLKTRTQQLLGQFDLAIPDYSRIRLFHTNMPSAVSSDVRDMHANAAEDAYFWSGVCQMEQEKPADAANKFGRYIEETEQFTNSRHGDHARILMGRCLTQIGHYKDALAAIGPLKSTSPEYPTSMYLKLQWQVAIKRAKPAVAENPGT